MRKFLKLDGVCQRYGDIDQTTIYRAVRAGKFPPPMKFGSRSLWSIAALDEHDRQSMVGVETRRSAAATAKRRKAAAGTV